MGLGAAKMWNYWFRDKECKMLMVGLDAAGKTTILYKLKIGDVVATIPTIGFNMETVQYKNVSFSVWDVGGQDKVFFICFDSKNRFVCCGDIITKELMV